MPITIRNSQALFKELSENTKLYCFTEDELQVISNALVLAEYEFTTTHNLLVTDLPEDDPTAWHLDYSNSLKRTEDALALLDKSGFIHKPEQPELPENS